MGGRMVDAVVATGLVVAGLSTDVLAPGDDAVHAGLGSFALGFGMVAVSAIAGVAWLAVLCEQMRRLVRPARPLCRPSIELTSRGEGTYVMAAFFTCFALVLMMIYVGNPPPRRPEPAFLIFPFAMGWIALMLAGARYGVRVHVDDRTVARWRGVRIGPRTYPMFERRHAIATDAKVSLYPSGHGHTISIDKPYFEASCTKNADVARLRAEQLAKLLAIPLEDRTASENEVRMRAVHELDQPLAEQLVRRGQSRARRPLPDHTTLVLEAETLPWVVRVQPRGFRGQEIVSFVFALPFIFFGSLLPAAILTSIVVGKPTIVVVPLAGLFTAVVSWYAIWRPMLRVRRETQRVRLSPSGIRVVRTAPGTHSAGELAAELIEEIVVTHNMGIWAGGLCVVARGDGVSLEFGHELEREDAVWLRDTAIAALAPGSIHR